MNGKDTKVLNERSAGHKAGVPWSLATITTPNTTENRYMIRAMYKLQVN